MKRHLILLRGGLRASSRRRSGWGRPKLYVIDADGSVRRARPRLRPPLPPSRGDAA